jgi:hypothetical protein
MLQLARCDQKPCENNALYGENIFAKRIVNRAFAFSDARKKRLSTFQP